MNSGAIRRLAAVTVVLLLRYLFLTRYSWMLAIAIISLVLISLRALPGVFRSLFVLDHPVQVFHVSWLALWCAIAVMETLRVTTLNAPYRFDDYRLAVARFRRVWGARPLRELPPWYWRWDGWLCFALGLATALAVWYVLMDACIRNTAADPGSGWETIDEVELHLQAWRFAFGGMATTLLTLAVLNGFVIGGLIGFRRWSERRFESASSEEHPIARYCRSALVTFDWLLGPGYFRHSAVDGGRRVVARPAPGHVGLLVYTIVFLMWYATNYRTTLSEQVMPTETSPYPPLFYGLLSLLLLIYLLPGMAFYFDRYRVPVSLVVVVVPICLYGWFGTDHYYEPNPPQNARTDTGIAELQQVYDRWQLPPQRTLVVVDASGGGIQACAWTAQVLTGLHELYGEDFSRSIGLISAVSGGSVATMVYAAFRADAQPDFDRRDPNRTVLSEKRIATIRRLSRASALEAVTWGIAYPDTLRAIVPQSVPKTIDRGWAIERLWQQRMADAADHWDPSDLRLDDFAERSLHNQLPVVVFNATVLETGQRLQLGTAFAPQAGSTGGPSVEFGRIFAGARPRVATAARLSATFPYVSPAVRGLIDQLDEATDEARTFSSYHIVDGAYADNEGAVTSVDWINRLITYYGAEQRREQCPFDRILLVRIQSFPRPKGGIVTGPAPVTGWRASLLGPLDAMLRVRVASQIERADLEIGLLMSAAKARMTVESATIDFRPEDSGPVPFSWKLTERQKRNIDAAWERIAAQGTNHPALAVIEKYFGSSSTDHRP